MLTFRKVSAIRALQSTKRSAGFAFLDDEDGHAILNASAGVGPCSFHQRRRPVIDGVALGGFAPELGESLSYEENKSGRNKNMSMRIPLTVLLILATALALSASLGARETGSEAGEPRATLIAEVDGAAIYRKFFLDLLARKDAEVWNSLSRQSKEICARMAFSDKAELSLEKALKAMSADEKGCRTKFFDDFIKSMGENAKAEIEATPFIQKSATKDCIVVHIGEEGNHIKATLVLEDKEWKINFFADAAASGSEEQSAAGAAATEGPATPENAAAPEESATPESAATTEKGPGIPFAEAMMCRNVTENQEPVDPTTVYPPGAGAFYCVVLMGDVPGETKVKAVFRVDNIKGYEKNQKIDGVQLSVPGNHYASFSLKRKAKSWPVGTYKVDLYWKGNYIRTLKFEVRP
jgi:hypothetical protein